MQGGGSLWNTLQKENSTSNPRPVSEPSKSEAQAAPALLSRDERLRQRERERAARLKLKNGAQSNGIGTAQNSQFEGRNISKSKRDEIYEKKRQQFLQKQQKATAIQSNNPYSNNLPSREQNNDRPEPERLKLFTSAIEPQTSRKETRQLPGQQNNLTKHSLAANQTAPDTLQNSRTNSLPENENRHDISNRPVVGPSQEGVAPVNNGSKINSIYNDQQVNDLPLPLRPRLPYDSNNGTIRNQQRENQPSKNLGLVFPSDSLGNKERDSQRIYAQQLDQQIQEKHERENSHHSFKTENVPFSENLGKNQYDRNFVNGRESQRLYAQQLEEQIKEKKQRERSHSVTNSNVQHESSNFTGASAAAQQAEFDKKRAYAQELERQILEKQQREHSLKSTFVSNQSPQHVNYHQIPPAGVNVNDQRNMSLNLQREIDRKKQYAMQLQQQIDMKNQVRYPQRFHPEVNPNNDNPYNHIDMQKLEDIRRKKEYANDLQNQIMHKRIQEQQQRQPSMNGHPYNQYVLPAGTHDLERQYRNQIQNQSRSELERPNLSNISLNPSNISNQYPSYNHPVVNNHLQHSGIGFGFNQERLAKVEAQNRYREELRKQQEEKKAIEVKENFASHQNSIPIMNNNFVQPHFVAGNNLMNPYHLPNNRAEHNPPPFQGLNQTSNVHNMGNTSSSHRVTTEGGMQQPPVSARILQGTENLQNINTLNGKFKPSVTNPMSEAEIFQKKQKQKQNYQELSAQIELIRLRKEKEKEAAKKLEEEEAARIERERLELQKQFEAEQEIKKKQDEHQKSLEAQIEEKKKRKQREQEELKKQEEQEARRLEKDRREIERKYSSRSETNDTNITARSTRTMASNVRTARSISDQQDGVVHIPKLKGTAHLFSDSPTSVTSVKKDRIKDTKVPVIKTQTNNFQIPETNFIDTVPNIQNANSTYPVDEDLRRNFKKQEKEFGRLKEQTRIAQEEQRKTMEELDRLRSLVEFREKLGNKAVNFSNNSYYDTESDDEEYNQLNQKPCREWKSAGRSRNNNFELDLTKVNPDRHSPIENHFQDIRNTSPQGITDALDSTLGQSLASDSKFIFPNGRLFSASVSPAKALANNSSKPRSSDDGTLRKPMLQNLIGSESLAINMKSKSPPASIHMSPLSMEMESIDEHSPAVSSIDNFQRATQLNGINRVQYENNLDERPELLYQRNQTRLDILDKIGKGETIGDDQLDAFLEEFLTKSKQSKIEPENRNSTKEIEFTSNIDDSLGGNTRWIPAPTLRN